MLEIELKFRADDWAGPRAAVRDRWRAEPLGTRAEEDHYFNAPDRDFAATGEAFRVRCVGEAAALTYKGPKRPGPVKTRLEIEVPLAGPADDLRRMLTALGYRPVAVVRKVREMYRFDHAGFALVACFDAVEGVGRFIELEAVADEKDAAAAQAAVEAAADELGLTAHEPRSYLRMVLAAQNPSG
jgi:adenylate cyclase class 2